MDAQERVDRMRKRRWEASARTLEAKTFEARLSRDAFDALRRAHDSFGRGAFAEALDVLGDVPVLRTDVQAQALAGLSYFGLDRYDDALEATERAIDLAGQVAARFELNRALILGVLARYDEALEAVSRARTLAPDLWAVPLGEIVVLERRRGPGDEARVDTLARTLRERWPQWATNGIGRFLATDIDYGPLRLAEGGARFTRLFGIAPTDLLESVEAHSQDEGGASCAAH